MYSFFLKNGNGYLTIYFLLCFFLFLFCFIIFVPANVALLLLPALIVHNNSDSWLEGCIHLVVHISRLQKAPQDLYKGFWPMTFFICSSASEWKREREEFAFTNGRL